MACWTLSPPVGITCLPQLQRLEHLTIELGVLLRQPLQCEGANIAWILPGNLKSLVLIERWRTTRRNCKSPLCQKDTPVLNARAYGHAFLDMLNQLARNQPLFMRKLARLTLVCNCAWRPWSLGGTPVCAFEDGSDYEEGRDPADACSCVRGLAVGQDVYFHQQLSGPLSASGENFASAAGVFAANEVAFEVGVLESGKYYRVVE